MSEGKLGETTCKHGIATLYCQRCMEEQMQVAITDGPIVTENITIDQRYRFEKQIKQLEARISELEEKLRVAESYFKIIDDHTAEYSGVSGNQILFETVTAARAAIGGREE